MPLGCLQGGPFRSICVHSHSAHAHTSEIDAFDCPRVRRYHGPLSPQEREFLIDNLLVRIHFIIEMILLDRSCAMGALPPIPSSSSPLLLWSREFSDTKVYEPWIRALLGTVSQSCKVFVLNSKSTLFARFASTVIQHTPLKSTVSIALRRGVATG